MPQDIISSAPESALDYVVCPRDQHWIFPVSMLVDAGLKHAKRVSQAVILALLEANVARLETLVGKDQVDRSDQEIQARVTSDATQYLH